ncbi:hypothetical protein PB01_10120 [Psychrobacillus glaciei]|uniref:Uncharacterized protein n=1 Tax=Psychrobacillus glaciei TaxID=2283160 RepID=A0A5J6SML8_9BACI|nr:hypothetical protein [Psychrobacillus glaciei]QFF99156.1 hypothetical protein PB01_10120 [Psychrobacillus glaciei]
MKLKHNALHQWQKDHNKRVAEFHNIHANQLANGENGTSWLAKIERFVYLKGNALLQKMK